MQLELHFLQITNQWFCLSQCCSFLLQFVSELRIPARHSCLQDHHKNRKAENLGQLKQDGAPLQNSVEIGCFPDPNDLHYTTLHVINSIHVYKMSLIMIYSGPFLNQVLDGEKQGHAKNGCNAGMPVFRQLPEFRLFIFSVSNLYE